MVNTSSLLGPQKPHVMRLVDSLEVNGYALDLSDTGCGKTYCGGTIARHYESKGIKIICPKSVIPSWRKVLAELGVTDYLIINYELLVRGGTPFMKWKKLQNPENPNDAKDKREIPVFKFPKDSLVILDEGHRCKGVDTSNAWMLISLAIQGYKTLVMSATLACSPLEMKAVGYLVKLHKLHNFKNFCLDFGADWTGKFGAMQFNAALEHAKKGMLRLNTYIFDEHKCASRLRREDFGDLFPESQNLPMAFDFGTNNPKIAAVYDQMEYELAKLEERCEGYREHVFAVIMAARRKVETLKVPLFVEMIEDHFDEGKAVAVFCNFRETIEAISFRLNKQKKFKGKVSFVVGGQKDLERQQNIEDFQNDVTQIILANIEAGGVGISLHDVHGHRPRVSIISPTWKANSIVQALGRVWRANGKSKCLQYIAYASECIEEEICVKVQAKINNLQTLNDAELAEDVRWVQYALAA